MATLSKNWRPQWWNNQHMSDWDRIKEAVRRDWEQTKRDLHVGGHELNQNIDDTVAQAAGQQAIPDINTVNPPTVIGDADWEVVEEPIAYGFGARGEFGKDNPRWTAAVEVRLRREWESGKEHAGRKWDDVAPHVRRGYEYRR